MFQGARIYKPAVKVGDEIDIQPVEVNDFFRSLLDEVFGGEENYPKSLKPKTVKGKKQTFGDIPNNAFSKVTFGAVDYDYGGFVPADRQDGLVMPPGITGAVRVDSAWHSGTGNKEAGFLYAWLTRSDSESLDMNTMPYTRGQDNVVRVGWMGLLKPGDYLNMVLLHALGKPMTEGQLKFATYMSLHFLGEVEASPTPPGPTPTPTPVRRTERQSS